MKRRSFISSTAGAAALAAGTGGCSVKTETGEPAVPAASAIGDLGGLAVEAALERYEYFLFEDYIPFHDLNVVDHETGAFYAATDHDGSHPNTDTNASFMGRGLWCYSFLYNHIEKNDRFLDIAGKAASFIMKHRPAGNDFWPGRYTREGDVVPPGTGGFAGDCYIAEGLAEYARATGETHYGDLARETVFKCLGHYDRPDFKDGSIPWPGARSLWYWMLLMWFGTRWLMDKPDSDLEALVERCVSAIMDHHQHPKFDLMNNCINHDLSRSEDPKHAELAACGHATEATWMIMYEAVRKKDRALFELSAERFRRHAVVSKDDVYGGYYNDCLNVDENDWQLRKISWAQAFILINSLYVVEHTGTQWAKDIFSDQFAWAQDKLPLKQYGYALWLEPRDRFATFVPKAGRKDNYHHPRHLMLNVASLRRMVDRGGRVSDDLL